PTTEQEEDENYDDVLSVGQVPPPLPPMKPEDRRIQAPSNNSEELTGPIEVIQNVKVTMDYKGGKSELSCKQGEWLEVVRITDNPEGKWLARTLEGSYGYIKVTYVDINYDEIKKKTGSRPKESMAIVKQPIQDQEVYDDVAPNDDMGPGSSGTGGSGFFPSPPSCDEIYDDVDGIPEDIKPSSASQDASKAGTWSWGLLKKKKAEKENKDKTTKEKENSEVQGESGERQLPSIPPQGDLAIGKGASDTHTVLNCM
ncbi:hypothetical protein scyTo_0020051, partial [Scyliorhinus torazame]|nr:hypothetical protein [Scyliorhinus torazame]